MVQGMEPKVQASAAHEAILKALGLNLRKHDNPVQIM